MDATAHRTELDHGWRQVISDLLHWELQGISQVSQVSYLNLRWLRIIFKHSRSK